MLDNFQLQKKCCLKHGTSLFLFQKVHLGEVLQSTEWISIHCVPFPGERHSPSKERHPLCLPFPGKSVPFPGKRDVRLEPIWKCKRAAWWHGIGILEVAVIAWTKRGQGRTKELSQFDTWLPFTSNVIIKVVQQIKSSVVFRTRFICLEVCKYFPIAQWDNYSHKFTAGSSCYGKGSSQPNENCHHGFLQCYVFI